MAWARLRGLRRQHGRRRLDRAETDVGPDGEPAGEGPLAGDRAFRYRIARRTCRRVHLAGRRGQGRSHPAVDHAVRRGGRNGRRRLVRNDRGRTPGRGHDADRRPRQRPSPRPHRTGGDGDRRRREGLRDRGRWSLGGGGPRRRRGGGDRLCRRGRRIGSGSSGGLGGGRRWRGRFRLGRRGRRPRGCRIRRGRRGARRSRACGEESERVDVAVRVRGDPDAEVDVGDVRRSVAARADRADGVALGHRAAALHAGRAEMDEGDGVAVVGCDRDHQTVGGDGARERDSAAARSDDRLPHLTSDGNAAVLAARIRIAAETELTQHGPRGRPGPRAGRGRQHEQRDRYDRNRSQ